MNLLLCSSSGYQTTEYLSHTQPMLNNFLAELPQPISQALFIPYASVTRSFDEYLLRVRPLFASFDIELIGLHELNDQITAIHSAPMIVVGGGNTFALLHRLQQRNLTNAIRDAVTSGTPYMGWSAGSNLAGTRISTTNDMPIVQPKSFDALSLVPFLINPHFISGQFHGHNGESREQRLAEFMVMNPSDPVVALVEGSALKIHDDSMSLIGAGEGLLFRGGRHKSLPLGECDYLLNPCSFY